MIESWKDYQESPQPAPVTCPFALDPNSPESEVDLLSPAWEEALEPARALHLAGVEEEQVPQPLVEEFPAGPVPIRSEAPH